MANLTAKFQIIDDMSAKIDAVAQSGENMLDSLDEIGSSAENAFDKVKSGSAQAAHSVDGVASAASSAANQATQMGDDISEAARRATQEAERLVDETEELGDKSEEASDKCVDAVEGMAQAFSAAGITAIVHAAVEEMYELASAASEAEKTIIGSTGATGKELDALMDSAERVFSESSAENLNQVATAMAAVRNASGLVGEDLENATKYALIFEDILGYDVSQSAQTASAMMKNFEISAEKAYEIIAYGAQNGADKNGDMLDVLNEYSAHYSALGLSADQFISSLIEGAEAGVFSVDKVGDAVKEFNIRAKDGSDTTSEAFKTLGMDSEVMAAQFATGGEAARDAFFAVISALNDMDDPMQKNATAVALFGTMYEDLESNILPVLGNIKERTLNTHDALDTVSTDAKSMSDRWTEAGNSLSTTFGSAVSPAISSVSETFAGLVSNVADYLEQHPTVAKAITAIGVGIGVVATAVAGYIAITKVAIPLIHSFGAALNTALGPIGWISLALTAVVAAGTAFAAMMEDTQDETLEMTARTREQYIELQKLETAYQDACDTYGETSEEASRLRYQLDDLSESFEVNRQTIEEFAAECQEVVDAHTEMVDRFDENQRTIDNDEVATLALIQRLSDLADGTYKTANSQAAMKDIIDDLNGSIDGLNLSYADVISNQKGVIQSVREMALAEAERSRQQEMYDEYVELVKKQAIEAEKLAEATDEATAAKGRFNAADAALKADHQAGGELGALFAFLNGTSAAYDKAKEKWDTAKKAQSDLQTSLDNTKSRIKEIEKYWDDTTDTTSENEGAIISWQSASEEAFAAVQTEMEELVQEYGEVYTAALDSLEGQFGLFDKASMKSEEYKDATVNNAQEALDSQLAYWESYSENLAYLQGLSAEQLGTTQANYDALISLIQDGSAESAGLAANMVKQIKSGNEDAVAELADTVVKVNAEREEIATATAEWTTDFSGKMGELTQTMESTVDGLQLDDEAAAAAKATIQAYADAILEEKDSAVEAAQQVANAVSAAFQSTYSAQLSDTYNKYAPSVMWPSTSPYGTAIQPDIPGHADGTTYSEDVFIAGEEGPELIVGHEGSTVFPTSETDRIVNAVNGMEGVTSVTFAEEFVTALERHSARRNDSSGTILVPPDRVRETTPDSETTRPQERTIRLEIAGSGTVNIGSGTSKEEVVDLLYANLKPVLMGIVQEEVFEEGDHSYDF